MAEATPKERIPIPCRQRRSDLLLPIGLILAFFAVEQLRPAIGQDSPETRPEGTKRIAPGWPQYRGPTGEGLAESADLPQTWSESENVLWKTFVLGSAWSSPAISGTDLWLTTTTEGGKGVRALRLDCRTGAIEVRTKPLFEIDRRGKIHPKNGHATPTPVVAGDRVFVHFGAHGTACLDREGNVLWKQIVPYYHHHGPATSPVLISDTLVIVCDGFDRPFYDQFQRQGVDAPQFVVGLDPETGKVRWKAARPGKHSYATPLAVEVEGRPQIVCPGGDGVWAYDPLNGKELWSCRFTGHSVVPSPVTAKGMIFVCTGYDNASLLAIRQGASGDCTDTHAAWQLSKGVPFVPSPIVVDDHLYLITDDGILSCVDVDTGKVVWKHRLGGNFAASPVAVGKLIYFTSTEGMTHVVRAGPKFEELARNQLSGKFFASPAVAANRLYLRSEGSLYCIGSTSSNEGSPSPPLARRPR